MRRRCIAGVLLLSLVAMAGCKVSEGEVPEASKPTEQAEETVVETEETEVAEAVAPEVLLTHHILYTPYQQENMTAVSGSFDTIGLSEESSKQYPNLQASLEDFSNETTASMVAAYNDNVDAALEYETAGMSLGTIQGSEHATLRVYRCDTQVISILTDVSNYLVGAAHGMYGMQARTYQVESGKALALTDVVTGEADAVASVIANQLRTNYPEVEFSVDLEDAIAESLYHTGESVWYLGWDNINFYFGPYQLAAYAAGDFSVSLSLDEYPELLDASYFRETEGSHVITGVPGKCCMEFDVDGDGQKDAVSISKEYGDESTGDYFDGVQIQVGEERLSVALPGTDLTPYYVWDKENHFYVYVVSEGMMAENMMVVCTKDSLGLREVTDYMGVFSGDDLSDEAASLDGIAEGTICSGICRRAFLNPDCFYLDERIDPLSTTMGRRAFAVARDGSPKPLQDAYEVTTPFVLTTLVELEVEVVADGSKRMLPVGEAVTIRYTDDATYVQGELSDGTEITIPCDLSWPQKVNGMDAESVFDGIFYAG